MLWTSDVTDVMGGIESDAFLTLLLADNLQAVIVDENGGCTSLSSVRLHRLLDGGQDGAL